MRKSLVILAAVALAACSRTETESHGGEVVVDTLNTPNIDATLGVPGDSLRMDSLGVPTVGSDTHIVKKPVVAGRKPVDMKDSLRRP